MRNTLTKKLSKYLSEYLNTAVIYAMDIFLSVCASGVVMIIATLLYTAGSFENSFIFTYFASSFVGSVLMFFLLKSYRLIIRHSTFKDILHYAAALLGKVVLSFAALMVVSGFSIVMLVMIVMDFFVSIFFIIIVRILMLMVYDQIKRKHLNHKNIANVVVYGTGEKSVATIARLSQSTHYHVVGFLSEDSSEKSMTLADHPVFYYNDMEDLESIIAENQIDAILFATEKEASDKQDTLLQFATDKHIKVFLTPTIDEIVGGKLIKGHVREIKIEDLLGRDEIKISMEHIIARFQGKVVMVTGAAGSIGSELCRQLATFGVKKLVLFDNAETPMHNIRLELEQRFPRLNFVPVIGDVRNNRRLDFAFRAFRPQVVFHAAAYKHVPLMEENPCEAVMVNVHGSRNVADKCIAYDVERMVMVSTDKAVNPTNIMGCTKRLAEIYVQSCGKAIEAGTKKGKTQFVTTRFGNVLGSNGSVIPRFREQIMAGGPVTVTHPEINRFFMTIPEACRLVMEAATLPVENRICVFDMGESVKIDTLARRMIRLAGFEPDKDIKIEYTGLRPGEKLYEEVLSTKENTLPTSHDRIRIASVRDYDYDKISAEFDEIAELSRNVEIEKTVQLMKAIVPEFKSKNSVFEKYDK